MNRIYLFADGYTFQTDETPLPQRLTAEMNAHGALLSALPITYNARAAAPAPEATPAAAAPEATPAAPAPKLPDSYPPAVRRLIAIQIQIRNLEAEAKETKDKLKEFMQKNNVPELIGEGWKAEYKTYPKTTFDAKQFALDHAKLYKKYVTTGTQTRLIVTATTVEGEEAV